MKFQFQSDVHLEVGKQYDTYKITPSAPYLILAGDIGNFAQYDAFLSFLREQCQNFSKVFLVLGNHEFYLNTRAEGVSLAERMTQEEGCKGTLFLLHRQRYDLDDQMTILGCTLNSHINDDSALMVRMRVHDFSKITDWTVAAHNDEHAQDVRWLRQQMKGLQGSGRKILVVTHHAPFRHGCTKPQYEESLWHDAFATALLEPEFDDEQDETPNILRQAHTWIFGHTHYTTQCVVGGVNCIANQRGYVFPWQMKKAAELEDANNSMVPDEPTVKSSVMKANGDSSSTSSKLGNWFKRALPFMPEPTKPPRSSFKVKYPGPIKGHEGDGSIPFDPLRCLEI